MKMYTTLLKFFQDLLKELEPAILICILDMDLIAPQKSTCAVGLCCVVELEDVRRKNCDPHDDLLDDV